MKGAHRGHAWLKLQVRQREDSWEERLKGAGSLQNAALGEIFFRFLYREGATEGPGYQKEENRSILHATEES